MIHVIDEDGRRRDTALAMTGEDKSYFLIRAEDELVMARRATHEKAARAHFMLAAAYFDRAYGPPVLASVEIGASEAN